MLEDISIVIPTLGRPILEQSLFWILVGSAWPGCLIIVEQGANQGVVEWLGRVHNPDSVVRDLLKKLDGD